MNRTGFQRLARIRLREAKLLLSAKAPDGAYYLAGYAVEYALKACIAKSTARHDFPEKQRVIDSYTHDASKLIRIAGLKATHDVAMRQLDFARSWDLVVQWSAQSRYRNYSVSQAEALIDAIENRNFGVLPWLKKHY